MEIDWAEVGKRIRFWRTARSLSQEDLCEELQRLGVDISQRSLSYIELGKYPAKVNLVLAVAIALNIRISDLMGNGEPQQE